jgi:hypothetical protein
MRTLAWLAVLFALGAAGCRARPKPEKVVVAAPARPAADRLAPGELAESIEQVFGIALPKGMRVERRFADYAAARGRVDADALGLYLRRRVSGGTMELGARTVFTGVRAEDAGDRTLSIEILREPNSTLLVVRDTTPRAAEPGLSEEERWKQTGIDRSGRIVDPRQTR